MAAMKICFILFLFFVLTSVQALSYWTNPWYDEYDMTEPMTTFEPAPEPDVYPESTAEPDVDLETTTEADVYPETTTEPDVYPETTTESDVYPESTAEPDVYPESTTKPDVYSESTTEPDVYSESTTEPDVYSESTTEPDVYSESTTEPDVYSESTTEPDVYPKSTYGTTEYKEEKDGSYIQDQKNELTNKEFFRNDYTHLKAVNSFYKIHSSYKTWFEARQVCAREGASLFYPENEDEQNAVMSFLSKTHPDIKWVFLGISDLQSEGVFRTIDGKLVSEVYTNWKPNEPNNAHGDEDCVEQDKTGKMNDCNCLVEFSFICKKSLSLKQNNGYSIDDYSSSPDTTTTADTESDVSTQSTYGGAAEYRNETDGSDYIIIPSHKNVITTSRPASDGSYIQVYQKNEYHNNGDPAKFVTIYKRCSEYGDCKDIHHLEIRVALDD